VKAEALQTQPNPKTKEPVSMKKDGGKK